MYHCGMRQIGERHVAYKVNLMVWSNRLDLLALSNFKGEVQIHRLHWQKVWNFPPPNETITVEAMAWRPDGKALAIGYSSGSVHIVDIEDKEILEQYVLRPVWDEDTEISKLNGITCITWAIRAEMLETVLEPSIYDDSSTFLQNLPSTSQYKNQGTDENNKDFKELKAPNQLHMLLVGHGTGYIYINVFGRYPYGTIHLAEMFGGGEYKVLDICISDDFSFMQVQYIDRITNNLYVTLINTSVLSAFAEEMFIVAKKHCEIVRLTSYLDQTMISITEAWEHILLEMDSKMADFAASVPVGGVSADLLELLMLGTPSDELELCLLQKLTVNDLKKLSNSIELSYSTIQKLVLKQLNIVGQSLTYYLSELRGLTRIPDRYKVMGIEENKVTAAIRACCAFLNKCLELQQVIDTSMRNYKAFFRWLFVVIVRLVGEQTPTEIVKITQQELGHIAEFLYNFDNAQVHHSHQYHGDSPPPDKPVKFNLERLGQYLENQELTILPDDEDNPWHKFLKDNSCLLKDNDTIFSLAEFKKFSLVQQQKHLKSAIDQVFDVRSKETGKYFSAIFNIKCYEDKSNGKLGENLRICQAYFESEYSFMMAFIDTMHINEGIHYMSIRMKQKAWSITAMKYAFSSIILGEKEPNDENISILDLQFYSFEYLSVVAQHPRIEENSIFIQVPVAIFQINAVEYSLKPKLFLFNDKVVKKNISHLIEPGVFKVLDKMDGFRVSVSGGRKVAVVLSKSQRKVRVFEMEVDGDDEEDETLDTTTQSQSTNNDQSITEKPNTSTGAAADVTF